MAKRYEDITDPKVRSYCRTMEAAADSWRKFTARVNELPDELNDLFRKYPIPSPDLAFQTGQTCAQLMKLRKESQRITTQDSKIRVHGFDARRDGKSITDNPHVSIVADLDSLDGYTTILKAHDAVPWYVGWKQGARAGEDHFPD